MTMREPLMTTACSEVEGAMRASILIAQDDTVMASQFQSQLDALGHTVCGITSLAGVDAACDQLRPDLVLVDVGSPVGRDGAGIVESLHIRHGIPVIHVAGQASEEWVRRVGVTNPFGYLLKPFTGRELALTLELALYRHGRDPKIASTVIRLNSRQQALEDYARRLDRYTAAIERVRAYDKNLQVSADLEGFFRSAVRELMVLIDARYGAMANFSEESGAVIHFIAEGMDESDFQRIGRLPQGLGILSTFGAGALRRIDDIAADPAAVGLPPGHPLMKSLLGLPLLVDGRTRAVLYLARDPASPPFSTEDEQIGRLYASQVEHMLERYVLHNDLLEKNRALEHERREQAQLLEKLQSAQQQLLQSEKMAAIGQLAAGVAHEINNPVGYIKSNMGTLGQYVENLIQMLSVYEQSEALLAGNPALKAALARDRETFDIDFVREDVRNLVRESNEGVARVKQIVQDLKEFSHAGEGEWQEHDIHKGLDSTLNIVWNELKYKADVVKQYGDLPRVECIPSQLNQVFMNILVNAAQAIEGRGTITLRTGMEGDGGVWIEIEDTGKGISPENLGRIFEPFFTTKEIGKGTGLGLSISYGIIRKHQGSIDARSEPGRGTTFRIRLPLSHGKEGKKTDYVI